MKETVEQNEEVIEVSQETAEEVAVKEEVVEKSAEKSRNESENSNISLADEAETEGSEEDAKVADVEEEESDVEDNTNEIDSHIKNLKNHDAANLLVKKAKIIVDEADMQLQECKLLLESDLKGFNDAKESLKDNGLDASEALLTVLGYTIEKDLVDDDMVAFVPEEKMEPMYIKDVSSGRFSSFIVALIVGFLTLSGLLYVATEKLGIVLNPSKMPTADVLNPIWNWFASLVSMPGNTAVGIGIVASAVLIAMWIVYKIRVTLRAGSNVKMAKEQLVAAEAYCDQKGSCKKEMDKVDAYINDAIETLKLYKVILTEERGKLERILHIEKEKIEEADFHPNSTLEMRDTQEMIEAIKDFMSVPMSEEGKLSGKSGLFLHRAKTKVQKVIDRLYA